MKSFRNVFLVLFVLFLLSGICSPRRLSKRLRQKRRRIKQGLIIMDSFIRALNLKNSRRVFEKLYTGTCIRYVFNPHTLSKLVRRHKRNVIRRVRRFIKVKSRRNKRNLPRRRSNTKRRYKNRRSNRARTVRRKKQLSNKTQKKTRHPRRTGRRKGRKNSYGKGRIRRTNRRSSRRQFRLIDVVYYLRKLDYSYRARKIVANLYITSLKTLTSALKKFLVKCYGHTIFLFSLYAIKHLTFLRRNREVRSRQYSRARVIMTMYELISLRRSLRNSRGNRRNAILRKIGTLLGKFALRSIHYHPRV